MRKKASRRATRTEHDTLGTLKLPLQAWYGAHTARALANYQISGRRAHPELIRAYLRLKWAAAEANRAAGALSPRKARLIQSAANRLLGKEKSRWGEIFPIDPYQAGAGTSLNMNVNEVIANLANLRTGGRLGYYSPIHPNDDVNRSQSTNDTFPTAMRLALLEASSRLVEELDSLAASLKGQARRWRGLPKAARTHLQDAVPMRLDQELSAYAASVARCARILRNAREEFLELGIGGSAAGTGLNVPRDYPRRILSALRSLTGEPRLRAAPDLFEAMQSQAPVAHYSSALRLLALELTRICNDLRLLASGPMTGLGELILTAVQPGSSIMPGKVNPSILEMANQAWYSVLGYDQTVGSL